MDTGNKTLAQLSEEGKEVRYVTLDVASKLSGYTKEYLERLCVLHKVNFLFWNTDQYAIELESLLKETRTILLSYEGLTFLEKTSLTTPPHEVATPAALLADQETADQGVISQSLIAPIPHFVENGRLSSSRESNAGMFSFTGRAVVSDSRHPREAGDDDTHIPIAVLHEGETVQDVSAGSPVGIPDVHVQVPERAVSERTLPRVPIKQGYEPAAVSTDNAQSVGLPIAHESRSVIPVPSTMDAWDEHFFGNSSDVPAPVLTPAPVPPASLPYHPIQTSVNAELHHEDLPLFPKLIDKRLTAGVSASAQAEENIPESSPAFSADPTPNPQSIHHSLPVPRVMPQMTIPVKKDILARLPEHHLALIEPHPLMKSVGFNLAFALLFLIPSFFLFERMPAEHGALLTNGTNLAAVAAMSETQVDPKTGDDVLSNKEERLEFSDEVVITQGDTPDSVLVQPVFSGGAGMVLEYMNARIESGATSTSQ